MATLYKGQHKMLCPYYISLNEKSITCNAGSAIRVPVRVRFESRSDREKFQQLNCYFAAPITCERYMEHRKAVEEGKEKPLKPRDSMDTKWKEYHTKWMQNRRKDPDYKY